MTTQRHLHTLDDTAALGQRLGELLFGGAVVALIGQLGAGKTTLARAIAVALGVEPRLIASPTFALIHEYPGRIPVYHFDAYRLNNVAEFIAIGVDEYFSGHGVCLVEWADRVASAMPAERLQIELAHEGEGRKATFTAFGRPYEEILARLD